jgi:hypothetical protein
MPNNKLFVKYDKKTLDMLVEIRNMKMRNIKITAFAEADITPKVVKKLSDINIDHLPALVASDGDIVMGASSILGYLKGIVEKVESFGYDTDEGVTNALANILREPDEEEESDEAKKAAVKSKADDITQKRNERFKSLGFTDVSPSKQDSAPANPPKKRPAMEFGEYETPKKKTTIDDDEIELEDDLTAQLLRIF